MDCDDEAEKPAEYDTETGGPKPAAGASSNMSDSKPCFIPWLRAQIDSCQYPGVYWTNLEQTEFTIPWKHVLRQDFTDTDTLLFKAWAEVKGNGRAQGDTILWKRRFHSALNYHCFKMLKDNKTDAANPHRVFLWPEESQSLGVDPSLCLEYGRPTCTAPRQTEVSDSLFIPLLGMLENNTSKAANPHRVFLEPEESQSVSEDPSLFKETPTLIQRVKNMMSVIDQLVEMLADLNGGQIMELMRHLYDTVPNQRHYSGITEVTDTQDAVFVLVLVYGQQSLIKTQKLLQTMDMTETKRTRPEKKEQPVDKAPSALIHKVATMAAVKEVLLETLSRLSKKEQMTFKWLLQKNYPGMSQIKLMSSVDLMVEAHGQRSVVVTREVLMDMNRTDLVTFLTESTSGLTESSGKTVHVKLENDSGHEEETCRKRAGTTRRGPKHTTQKQDDAKTNTIKQNLWRLQWHLSQEECVGFKWLLQFMCFQRGLPQIPWEYWCETIYRIVMLVIPQLQWVEVIAEILRDINRSDLIEGLSENSSEPKGKPQTKQQVPRGWTKLQPEVNHSHPEAPTYSLESDAGCFECRVSGLRWVCEDKVTFKYQFCSWDGHLQWMEYLHYMPAGPLIDITAAAGRLAEVHLPHWIDTADNPVILGKFAVLHIDDYEDLVEQACEVTSSHVKLWKPIFSPSAALVKMGVPVKIRCSVLIYYKSRTANLTLHVYLIPHDPALQEAVKKKKASSGFELMEKPRSDPYLTMQQRFTLTTDAEEARIQPEKLTLRCDSQDPSFYEVFIENPDSDVHLLLSHPLCEAACDLVWSCEISKGDYSHTERLEDSGFCS